jgi:hypothetical protein
MTRQASYLPVAEVCSKVVLQRMNPDGFDRLGVAVEPVELATALRAAEIPPVGGLIAGAGEARLRDEGLDRHRTVEYTGSEPRVAPELLRQAPAPPKPICAVA